MSFYQINPKKINWQSEKSAVFFNEKLNSKQNNMPSLASLPHLKGHVWLTTSGSTSQKWIALSKKALLTSARAVNQHLRASSRDRWGRVLPLFHVGGLSILARAYLSQSRSISYRQKWSPTLFVTFLKKHKITLCSLVPTQVYDLVRAGCVAPADLRAVVVGGAHLSPALYQAGRRLNWPLLPSYGMTECGSQVATAELRSLKNKNTKSKKTPPLKILPHVKVKIVGGEITLQSKSLLTCSLPLTLPPDSKGKRQDFRVRVTGGVHMTGGVHVTDGVRQTGKAGKNLFHKLWYATGDKGFLRKKYLYLRQGQLKILGEKVNFKDLEQILMGLLLKNPLPGRCMLLPLPSEREGVQPALVSDVFHQKTLTRIVQEFNKKVSPFEKIKAFYLIPAFPLTGISKISQPALWKILGLKKPVEYRKNKV